MRRAPERAERPARDLLLRHDASAKPRFLFSTADPNSSITDDFLPLPEGGFLVTQMGSADGGVPGRVVEFDRQAAPGRLVAGGTRRRTGSTRTASPPGPS